MTDRPVAVVTGATGGMGEMIVADLARDHDVIALGRNAEQLAALDKVAHVRAVEYDVVAELLDASPEAPSVPEALGVTGRVDVLVHAAAIARNHSVESATVDIWRSHFDLNVTAPAELTRQLLPALREAQGRVIFINSGAGNGAYPDNVVYAASKHALRALADGLRKSEAPHGVRVATVAPGPTDTPMLRGLRSSAGSDYTPEHYIEPAEVADAIRLIVAAGASAQITELAVRPRIELADRK